LEEIGAAPRDAVCACAGETWHWVDIPADMQGDFACVALDAAAEGDGVVADTVLLTAGAWPDWDAGDRADVPAACFFRAGYTALPAGAVVLRRESEADRTVLYGPRLPLEPGVYTVELGLDTPAVSGTLLGRLEMDDGPALPVRAGETCRLEFACGDNRPWTLAFVFARNADVTLERVRIERIR
ncbi:MAG: hypothetical protein JW951_03750, partial [Lentisphaerae bacterium]|nr:hypothetical protein [Lentisphaerota bacterium]